MWAILLVSGHKLGMYKFGKKQQSSVKREAELSRLPQAADLRSLLATAQRNAQKSIELAFYTADSPVKMTLVVNCEQHGKESAFWSLYRTDVVGLPVVWTQQSSAIDLVQNLVELGYSTAVEAYKSEISTGASESGLPAEASDAKAEGGLGYISPEELSWSGEPVNSYTDVSRKTPTRSRGADQVQSFSDNLHAANVLMSDSSVQTPPNWFGTPESEQDNVDFPGEFSVPQPAFIDVDQALAQSKERKQQALIRVLERLTAEESIACRREIIDAVRLVVNPFDTTNGAEDSISNRIEGELNTLVGLFGEQEVAIALAETFTHIFHGKTAPYVSAIDEVTSRWFF